MIVVIDNYDSFTYNLVQYLGQVGAAVRVFRNDAVPLSHIDRLNPSGLLISPGPGRPESAGISMDAIRHYCGKIPILGVCLGHQSITAVFGGSIVHARRLMHGKTSEITADGKHLFAGIKKPFTAMRYHSLVASRKDLPDTLEITAESDDGEIMGVRHRHYTVEGIQFHPESIMTPVGKRLLRNFVNMTISTNGNV
jgi:anthranilate synthase/aminodeoxychorismate synthase-like glutamine amidotransferase